MSRFAFYIAACGVCFLISIAGFLLLLQGIYVISIIIQLLSTLAFFFFLARAVKEYMTQEADMSEELDEQKEDL